MLIKIATALGVFCSEQQEAGLTCRFGAQGVWASLYNERALLSIRKVGLDLAALRMAVLVQRVVPAEYAFVVHTHNPTNGSADEIYAEVVRGLGEAIVSGDVPGSALAFAARKADLNSPQVHLQACFSLPHFCFGEVGAQSLLTDIKSLAMGAPLANSQPPADLPSYTCMDNAH